MALLLENPGMNSPFGYQVGVAVESALATTSQDRLKVLAEVNARLRVDRENFFSKSFPRTLDKSTKKQWLAILVFTFL